MAGNGNLWQKSLGPVTSITGLIPVDCDVYHGPMCESALSGCGRKPTIAAMSSFSELTGDVFHNESGSAPRTGVQPSDAVSKSTGFRSRPLQVTWEMTHACGWKASPARERLVKDRQQFSTAEAFHLVEEVAGMHVPLFALTGGDPLLRPDLLPIVEFASKRSLRTSLTLLPTPRLDPEVISELKACGLMRVAFWLHGSTPGLNDGHWKMPGLHRRTLEIVGTCHEVQLPVQINTIVSRRNFQDIDPMIELL